LIKVYTMESSDWTENQKGLIKYYDPERYEKIWGKVKAVITEAEPEPEPETKKEEESAAE
tara:strand:- start:760 stop:939 length:180 start_codon:yes stop_codon:yes gene_type:complete